MSASVFGLGVTRETLQINESILQIAEGSIGAAQPAKQRLKGPVLQTGQRFREDQIAHRRQRETIGHITGGRRCLGGCRRLRRLLIVIGRILAEGTCDAGRYNRGTQPQPATAKRNSVASPFVCLLIAHEQIG